MNVIEGIPTAICIDGLTRTFGDLVAVDHLDLAIPAGSIFGLLGPNGAGKTTTIKMLTTLLPPTSGRAEVVGFDIEHQPREVRRAIGYVPQLLSADGGLTGRENLTLFARLHGVSRKDREERIPQALEMIGLTEVADNLVRRYSGGMIRRLEIAQAILHRPGVLFLDEPTVGLDPVARRAVWDHVKELRVQFGATILLTTHYMEEAESLCDQVAIMHQGKVVAEGSPAELMHDADEAQTLDEAFVFFAGSDIETGGSYRDTASTRRTVRRLG
jgi:ABC-2 type transport system ATP-binding protein